MGSKGSKQNQIVSCPPGCAPILPVQRQFQMPVQQSFPMMYQQPMVIKKKYSKLPLILLS